MNTIQIKPGVEVMCKGERYLITRYIDLHTVMAEDANGGIARLEIKDIMPLELHSETEHAIKERLDLMSITEDQWVLAQERFAVIKPILDDLGNGKLVAKAAKKTGKNKATIYRWVEKYQTTGLVSSLINREKSGGRGKSRLSPEIDLILKDTIEKEYLNKERHKIGHTCLKVIQKCKTAGLKPPHPNTIRNRIHEISEETRLRARYGSKVSDEKFKPKDGKFPGADFPLAVVQIDHTKSDIILVDEVTRIPIGRPWLTLAIDVYSRMCVGVNISLDPPGAMGTGVCLANSILPKDKTLAEYNLNGEWPSWGIMNKIHADNAGEFRGTMIKRACAEYGIKLEWRLIAKPNYGGHIERLMGTQNEITHNLPGTTFSNSKQRGSYDSVGKAALSLKEFEEIFLTYITEIYHKRFHKGINNTPLAKYMEGIFGTPENPGTGFPTKILDERKTRLDFMPYFLRTIQEYGVKIDHIDYYHDVLRKWIHSTEKKSGKYKVKTNFIFKRDPRDISKIYFWDPELKDYFPIPYRNIGRPSISIWEFRKALKGAKTLGRENVDEESIFRAYERITEIKETAVRKKMVAKKAKLSPELREFSRKSNYIPDIGKKMVVEPIVLEDIKPFEDLDHGTSL
ncbi:MAG: DDE-type integrase/transposase/recombinase [Bacteroidetes bacterium]|nr:DDE-type integrase/transposase/recombinase [Bacteroidota bacterium]